jgi:hypothetical protein
MNLARIAENLGVRNLAHFDGGLEALCPNSNSDGGNGQPAISALRTGLETLEAGTLSNRSGNHDVPLSKLLICPNSKHRVSWCAPTAMECPRVSGHCQPKTTGGVADQTSVQPRTR